MKVTPKFFRLLGHEIAVCFIFFSNFIPIYGVLKWGWQVSEIMFLFCAETIIIAIFAVAKMFTAQKLDKDEKPGFARFVANLAGAIGLLGVCGAWAYGASEFFDADIHFTEFTWESGIGLAVTGLMGSYFMMFILDYLLSRKFMQATSGDAMLKPAGRLFYMVFLALFCGGLAKLFNAPLIPLIVICTFKMLWDIGAYLVRNFGSLKVDGEYVYGGPKEDEFKVNMQAEPSEEQRAEIDEIRRRIKPK